MLIIHYLVTFMLALCGLKLKKRSETCGDFQLKAIFKWVFYLLYSSFTTCGVELLINSQTITVIRRLLIRNSVAYK